MSIATAPPALRKTRGPSVPPDEPPTVERHRMRPFGDRRLFGPGWPLKVLFIGFPLWWVIGLSEPMCFVAGALMALELLHRRRLEFPRGFVVWAMFLVFVVGGVFLLQVDVFGAVPGGANTRYVTWAYRLAWYLTATTLMLYIGNLRRELSLRDVTRTISWMFVTLTAGGLLGVLVPTFTFQSLMELVLPHSIDSIAFVRDLIHPSVAQLYTAEGELNPRPVPPSPTPTTGASTTRVCCRSSSSRGSGRAQVGVDSSGPSSSWPASSRWSSRRTAASGWRWSPWRRSWSSARSSRDTCGCSSPSSARQRR